MKKSINSRKRAVMISAVCFFTAVLVLTFFSNTIMNASLPEITAQYVKSGRIYDKISGSGIASADDVMSIYPECAGTIAELAVSSGDSVEKGDLLCTIHPESAPLSENTDNSKEAAYYAGIQIYLRQGLSFSDAEICLENDKTALKEEIFTAYRLSESSDSQTRSAVFKAELDALQNDIAYVSADAFEKLPQKYQAEIGEAYVAYEAAVDAEEQAQENYGDAQSRQLGDPDTLRKLADDAYAAMEQAYEDYLTAFSAWQEADSQNSENTSQLKETSDSAWSLYESASNAYNDAARQLEDAIQAENDILYAEQSCETAEEKREAALETLNTALNAAEASVKKDICLLEILLNEAAAADILLDFNEDGTVSLYAETDGTISELSVSSGDMVMTSASVMKLIKADSTYTVSFNASAKKAQNLRNCMEAAVINADAQAQLKGIYNAVHSSSGSADEKTLLFTLTGDITNGQTIALKLSENSRSYDFTVPSRAVSEDSSGKFILAVETKSTPLGNRYYAKKINVSVLADDGTNAAISGEISTDTYVISLSTEPIEAGDQVRMKETAE